MGTPQRLTGGPRAADADRDLRERPNGSGHPVGGGTANSPHDEYQRAGILGVSTGFVAPVPVRWSDIDMYQHVKHATTVTILEEARVPFLSHAFGADITRIGLLLADVRVTYKGQLRLADSPLPVTLWGRRFRGGGFTPGY